MTDSYPPERQMIDMLWPGIRAIQADGPPAKDFVYRDGGYYLSRNDGKEGCILTDAEVRDDSWKMHFNARVREVLCEP